MEHQPQWQRSVTTEFGDDALACFTERVDPEAIRRRVAETLKLAKANKVFEGTAFIGLAIDGTAAGHTTKEPCPFPKIMSSAITINW